MGNVSGGKVWKEKNKVKFKRAEREGTEEKANF